MSDGTTKYYKVLKKNGQSTVQDFPWHLPKDGTPGKWMPRVEKLELCVSGYHLCRREDLVHWVNEAIYEAEVADEVLKGDDKVVVHRVRLLRKFPGWTSVTARLFAADCAEHVLENFEKTCPEDSRPRLAIHAGRSLALGIIDTKTAYIAGQSARVAGLAINDIAASDTAHASSHVAFDGSWFAIDAAMYSAISAGAEEEAERAWQTDLLLEYLERSEEESIEIARKKLEETG